MSTKKDATGYNLKQWLYVGLCVIAIFSTIPVAREIQRFVYDTLGREFFTNSFLFIVCSGLVILLCLFIFKLKVKRASQYVWLFACAIAYIYLNAGLKEHPEEAFHLLEYGLLSYLTFRALSHKIRDNTIYPTAGLFVLLVGIGDEFLQWLTPERYWGFNDVRLNGLAGGIFLLALWKGFRPAAISGQVKRVSIRILACIITADLIVLGLCLSNTPDAVKRYTAPFKALSWLRYEEPMAEYGYKHNDPDIGILYSRFTIDNLKEIDLTKGESFGKVLLRNTVLEKQLKELLKKYNPHTEPFLYEFLIHASRRNDNFEELIEVTGMYEKIRKSNIAFKENLILEKYFGNTMKYSGLAWPGEKVDDLKKTALLQNEEYISNAGQLITAFTQKTALTIIFITLIVLWTALLLWEKIFAA